MLRQPAHLSKDNPTQQKNPQDEEKVSSRNFLSTPVTKQWGKALCRRLKPDTHENTDIHGEISN